MWNFFVRVVCERECEDSRQLKTKEVLAGSSWVAFLRSEACAQYMTGIWRVMTNGDGDSWFLWVFMGNPRDTCETFYFAILSYLIHPVSTHTIYTHITHICWGVLSERIPQPQPLRVRDCHTHNSLHNPLWFFSTLTSPFPNPWEVDSSNTYHTQSECKVRFWCYWEALEEAICLVDAIGLNCVIWRAREDKAWRSQSVAGAWRARVHGVD